MLPSASGRLNMFLRSVTQPDAFDHHRMHRKQRRRQPGTGTRNRASNRHSNSTLATCSSDVHQVIAQRRQSPQVIFEPKCRMNERVILRHGADLEPHSPQPVEQCSVDVASDVRIVIPDETGTAGAANRRPPPGPRAARASAATMPCPGRRGLVASWPGCVRGDRAAVLGCGIGKVACYSGVVCSSRTCVAFSRFNRASAYSGCWRTASWK